MIEILTSKERKITCVCVTRARPNLLRRTIASFLAQTHEARELVVAYETDDAATPDVLDQFATDRRIIPHPISTEPKRTLGALRNEGIRRGSGEYFCQWDDDDWSHPQRLSEQLDHLQRNRQDAVALTHWLVFDRTTRRAYLSNFRLWEGSLLCAREAFDAGIRYPNLSRMEDSFFLNALLRERRVIPMVAPWLYIYEIHEQNTWNGAHFETVRSLSQPLSDDTTRHVAAIMEGSNDLTDSIKFLAGDAFLKGLNYFAVNRVTDDNLALIRHAYKQKRSLVRK